LAQSPVNRSRLAYEEQCKHVPIEIRRPFEGDTNVAGWATGCIGWAWDFVRDLPSALDSLWSGTKSVASSIYNGVTNYFSDSQYRAQTNVSFVAAYEAAVNYKTGQFATTVIENVKKFFTESLPGATCYDNKTISAATCKFVASLAVGGPVVKLAAKGLFAGAKIAGEGLAALREAAAKAFADAAKAASGAASGAASAGAKGFEGMKGAAGRAWAGAGAGASSAGTAGTNAGAGAQAGAGAGAGAQAGAGARAGAGTGAGSGSAGGAGAGSAGTNAGAGAQAGTGAGANAGAGAGAGAGRAGAGASGETAGASSGAQAGAASQAAKKSFSEMTDAEKIAATKAKLKESASTSQAEIDAEMVRFQSAAYVRQAYGVKDQKEFMVGYRNFMQYYMFVTGNRASFTAAEILAAENTLKTLNVAKQAMKTNAR
jgi:hypothetical protein